MASVNVENIELTKEEELAAAKLAGTAMGKLCFFGAKLFKGTGYVLEKSTSVTATGLRYVANGVEKGGQVSSKFCYNKADKLKAKSEEYEMDTYTVKNAQEELNRIFDEMKGKGVRPTINITPNVATA